MTGLHGIEPDPNSLCHFGREPIVQIPSKRQTKLDERAQHGKLIGYPAARGWMACIILVQTANHTFYICHFPDFQNLLVKNQGKPGDLNFVLNKISLQLGEENTEEIAEVGQKAIDQFPTGNKNKEGAPD